MRAIKDAVEASFSDTNANHLELKTYNETLTAFKSESQAWQGHTDSTQAASFQTVQSMLRASDSESASQFSQVLDKLGKLELCLRGQDGHFVDSPENRTANDEISGCIDRLCRLASLKPSKVTSHEAESIIDDLETVLTKVESTAGLLTACRGQKKRKAEVHHDDVSTEQSGLQIRDVKRVRRGLATHRNFDVNDFKPGVLNTTRQRGRIKFGQSQVFEIQGATVLISYYNRNLPNGSTTSCNNKHSGDLLDDRSRSEEVEGRVSLLMPYTQAIKLNVIFHYKNTHSGINGLNPTISFHCMRPEGSRIFKIAGYGSVEDMLELRREGDASLSDCDVHGRTLLYVRYHSFIQDMRLCSD